MISVGQHRKAQTFYDLKKKVLKEEYYVLVKSPQVIDSLYISYYQNGNIKTKGSYKKGKPFGIWEYFFENGNRRMIGTLDENTAEGNWIYYFENGNISSEGELKKGQREGRWKYYYENQNIKSEGWYKKDKKEGIWKYFYEEGLFKAQAIFDNDKGRYEEVYPSGKIKSEGDIINGKSNGLWKYYYEDGAIKGEGQEKDGVKEGMWKFYHPNGNLLSQGVYNQGATEGKWRYYYDNGNVSSEGIEKDGKKDGYWKLFYKNGAFKGEGNFNIGDGLYKEYFENGKLKIEGSIRNGKNNGLWKYYYENGTLEGTCFFTDGQGKYTGYYESGNINMQGPIVDGIKVGIWKLYKEDGTISGYYKTYYENDQVMFRESAAKGKDTLARDTIVSLNKPKLKLPKKKSRYFTKKVNEFQSIILSSNPGGVLIGRLPVSLEYYFQERLGYEINYTMIRSPFFKSVKTAGLDNILDRGFSASIKQKFYQRDQDIGMFYFAHEVRFSRIGSSVRFLDSTDNGQRRSIQQTQHLFEYSILVGDRIMGDATKRGWTVDIFAGVGVGFRLSQQSWDVKNKYYSSMMPNAKTSFLSLPFRFGVNIGYAFKKKRGIQ